MFEGPDYRIIVRKFKGLYDYSPGDVIAEVANWYNLGWADYVNDVPEAFFTILQNEQEPVADLLRQYEGIAHVEVRRNNDVVFRGWLMESDITDKDCVFYCYGYLAGLYWQATEWATVYTSQNIGQIVTAEWNQARNRQLSWTGSGGAHDVSMLKWINTGTIEAPVTTSGGATPIVLPDYKVHHKRVLFLLRELASIAMSDTTNTVLFQITQDEAPIFNFWKDRSVDRPGVRFEWGDDQISGYRHMRAAVNKRNRLRAVGSNPQNVTLRQDATGTADIPAWGLREEAMYLAWVRDQTELTRVALNRLARARRIENDLMLRFYPNSVEPPWNASSNWRLADRVRVFIDHGATLISGLFHTIGSQTVVGRGGVERTTLLLQELVGT